MLPSSNGPKIVSILPFLEWSHQFIYFLAIGSTKFLLSLLPYLYLLSDFTYILPSKYNTYTRILSYHIFSTKMMNGNLITTYISTTLCLDKYGMEGVSTIICASKTWVPMSNRYKSKCPNFMKFFLGPKGTVEVSIPMSECQAPRMGRWGKIKSPNTISKHMKHRLPNSNDR